MAISFEWTAQVKATPPDSLCSESFLNTVQQGLTLFYSDYANSIYSDEMTRALNYEPTTVPVFSDEVYCSRLATMSNASPFQFDCNSITLASIKNFAATRRSFAKIVLGRSALYFDLFEEKLAEYGLPLELKFLSVIESGLRPQVKSKAGALGLWQFMYKTGLYFGLEENSYIDERMDPIKSTDAACRYLKQLYGIYGDWNLSLAAYNAGPGTVNRAIQRSGNLKTYWGVRPFLPSETQGYVPTFIATAYLLTHHSEHNVIPVQAKVHNAQLDTMCLKKGMSMENISTALNWDLNEIKTLNPVYKTSFIPASTKNRCVTGPLEKITLLISLEDSLIKSSNVVINSSQDSLNQNMPMDSTLMDSLAKTYVYHKIKSGETMKSVASRYGVSQGEIMEWNALQTSNVYVGQKLTLKKTHTQTPPAAPAAVKKYYTVKSGDSLSKIASKYNITLTQLKKLNPGCDKGSIHPGEKLRVK